MAKQLERLIVCVPAMDRGFSSRFFHFLELFFRRGPRCAIFPILIFAATISQVTSFRIGIGSHRRFLRPLCSHSLTTAFQWLCEERYENDAYQGIAWIDPSDESEIVPVVDGEIDLPLYPLEATYVPANQNHTLNNVEPRNIRMANDLLASEDRRFCAVLSASDTGRVATVGTVLRILEAEKQEHNSEVTRIRLTCQAEALAEITCIMNPQAFSRENRLRRSDEYLKARVRPLKNNVESAFEFPENLVSRIVNDFNMVKTMYQLEIGSHEMPPKTLSTLGNALPSWSEENFKNEMLFWEAAQEWQSVCYTIRQAKQAVLSADRNELMISAATKKGGPLKLPIHMEELSPTVQREIQLMEVESQKDWVGMRLDPCLDFQALISIQSPSDRMKWLSNIISRERQRLEDLASSPNPRTGRSRPQENQGAWFN